MTGFVRNTDNCDELQKDIFYQQEDLKAINRNLNRKTNDFERARDLLNKRAEDLERSAVKGFVEVFLETAAIGKIARVIKKFRKNPNKSAAIIQALDNFQRALNEYHRAFRRASDANQEMIEVQKELEQHLDVMRETQKLHENCKKKNKTN